MDVPTGSGVPRDGEDRDGRIAATRAALQPSGLKTTQRDVLVFPETSRHNLRRDRGR